MLRQQLDLLPSAPYVSDRRWKKAIRLLQASALFSGRDAVAPIDLILLKDCLWHDAEGMNLMQQQLDVLMTGHAWGQQSMLNQLGAIAQRRLQLQQQQSDKNALEVLIPSWRDVCRKPHYGLPAGLTDASLTLTSSATAELSMICRLCTHVTIERVALVQWLAVKGRGEISGKLNGIGFAQPLSMEVDSGRRPRDP